MKRTVLLLTLLGVMVVVIGCASVHAGKLPDKADIFVTSGDAKFPNYTPLGVIETVNIGFSIFGLWDVIPVSLQDGVEAMVAEAKQHQADAVISFQHKVKRGFMIWCPSVCTSGTAIQR
jgi:hypothetical protein